MRDVIIAGILLGVCQIAGFVGFAFLLRAWFDRKQAEIVSSINDELSRLVSGEPCQSGKVLNAIGEMIGQNAGRSAKAALMADLSHLSRAQNSAATDTALAEVGAASPGVGAMLGAMSKRGAGKMLQNPFVQLALSALTNRPAQASGGGDNGGAVGNIQERIKKGG